MILLTCIIGYERDQSAPTGVGPARVDSGRKLVKRYLQLFSPRHRVTTASLLVICLLAVAIPAAAFVAQRSRESQHKTVSVSTTSSQMIFVYSHLDKVETPLVKHTQKPTANPVTKKIRPTATTTTNNTGNFG